MRLWRSARETGPLRLDWLDWVQGRWPGTRWPRLRVGPVTLELRYWNPGVMRRDYRHYRACGFRRREAAAARAAHAIGVWWTPQGALRPRVESE